MQSTIPRASLQNDLAIFKAQIEKRPQTPEDLVISLRGVYRAFLGLEFSGFDLGEHWSDAPQLMSDVFDLRLALRNKIPQWHQRGMMSREAQTAARDVMRITRYAGDILGELRINHERLDPSAKPMRAFTGNNNNTLISPKIATGNDAPFKSGDVILTRGRLYNSAAIARIGDVDSQFAHVGMVYIDADGAHWCVQSIIEEGAQIVPLNDFLNDDIARAIVFRHRDQNLAQRAAYVIQDRVRHSLSKQGKRILYDFTMRIDNRHNLYCSKLVRRAFKEASDERVLLPTFPTRLDMTNRDFPDRIGVLTTQTYAPGDIELEPDFDVVAEWQDYRATADLRLQDIAMDKVFEWMDEKNLRFHETFLIKLISYFGRTATYMSPTIQDIIFKFIPKIPPNMGRRAVAAIAMLNETGEELLQPLRKQDKDTVGRTGLPMHPTEINASLEQILEESNGEVGYLKPAR